MTTAYEEALKIIKKLQLTNATTLYLTSNFLGSNRDSLRLTDIDLVCLWPEISHLSSLTSLYLSDHQLTTLPNNFSQLSNLTSLDLSHNQLTTLPNNFSQLSNLSSLDLSHNYLAMLPNNFNQLSNLTSLNLFHNQLTTLPDNFNQLSNLSSLDLSHNQLIRLPDNFEHLSQLEQLYLQENPALNIPPEILEPTWADVAFDKIQFAKPQEILRYYFEQQSASKRALNEAKLLIVGQGDVGKTSLIKRLLHNIFDPHEDKTDGINITQWYIPNQRAPDQQIRVNIWDFGGQEIMHATHQFFLTERSLYLIVLKARREVDANRLDYWLQKVQSYGGHSPVLIILNQIDQHAQELDTRFYEEKYPNLIVGWHKTSCATQVGLDDLRHAIHTHINAFDGVHTPFAKSWFNVKATLEQMPDNYITRDHYAVICHENGVAEPQDQRILLRFMHDLGIALNFDTLELKDTHILNPRWVTRGVYAILNDPKLTMDKGVLTPQHLHRILHQPAYQQMHNYIVHIMQRFELCFPAKPPQTWLIPDLVTPVEPDTGRWDDVLRFRYHYPNVLEPSIMTRFITRMHERISNHTFWRTGAIIKLDGNRAHVRADRDAKRIDIRIQGHQPTRRALLALIREAFRQIHATIPHLLNEEHVPLPNQPEVSIRYSHLLKLEQTGEETYFPDGADAPISIATLLNGIEDPSARVRRLERELKDFRQPMPSRVSSQTLTSNEQQELNQLEAIQQQAQELAKLSAENARRWGYLWTGVIALTLIGLLFAFFWFVDFESIERWGTFAQLASALLFFLGFGVLRKQINLPERAYKKVYEKQLTASLTKTGFNKIRYKTLAKRK